MTLTTAPRAAASRAAAAEIGFAGALVRPDDQLRLTFELVGGFVDATTNRIEPLLADEPIFYVISFGSQHTIEATIATAATPPDEAQPHRRALPSRVSVGIPAGTDFTVGNLLALASHALRVDPRADGADGDPHAEPDADVTAIEVPATLILSPPSDATFAAATTPRTRGDVGELWRARLTAGDGASPTVRAIAHRLDDNDFPAYVDQLDDVVAQTSGGVGIPLDVTELTLSSHGATVDLAGSWPAGLLAAYRHRAINGRDLHVELVTRGHLAPFGHAATLTTLVERDLRNDTSGDLTAALTEDVFVAIAEPTVSYGDEFTALMPHGGRRLPFVAVTAVDPGSGAVGKQRIVLPNGSAINRDKACLLTRDGADLAISYAATDRNGRQGITFELPAVFVADTEAYVAEDSTVGRKTVLAKLATWYAESASDAQRDLQLGGQAVGWADPSPRGGAGSVQTTNRIRITLDRPDLTDADPGDVGEALQDLGRPAFHAGVDTAWIVDLASTTTVGGDAPEVAVTLAQRWLDHGVGDLNVDLGYLDLAVPDVLSPATDALGMLAASINVGTFGQFLGAGFKFPELDGAIDWNWDPLAALGDIGGSLPKLLGSLDLTDLIPSLDLTGLDVPDGLPALNVEPQFDPPDAQIPTGVCFHFTWEPRVQSFPKDSDKPTFVADADTHVLLALTTCVPENRTTFTAALERFTLQLPPEVPVVAIDFEHVTYTNDNGSSNVEAKVADWRFIGALSWLEPLKDFLAGLLDCGVPTFDAGIFIDYSLPIPRFALGVLGVSGLRVDLGLDLPDDGASNVALDVGTRDDPFRITIMGFGGDGSFGLEVDARDIVMIEGSLAVTYELAVDVFVVGASLSASLGVFVVYEDGTVTLGAYAELRGTVSVLGLVELSGAVTVGLTYNITTKLLRGVAAVTAEVSSIFGKSDVTRDVEVEVALGDGAGRRIAALAAVPLPPDPEVSADLSFRDHYNTLSIWTEYCAAFVAA